MPQAITKYQTTDGQVFDTESDAKAHELGLEHEAQIDKFLEDAIEGTGPGLARKRTEIKRYLMRWITWAELKEGVPGLEDVA